MKDKKHIDELFKEQLQNFEAVPSPEVWDNIRAKMKKEKEDRKIIPLWWKLGGIAAMLALLLTIGNFVFHPFSGDDTTVIVTEEKDKAPVDDKETTPVLEDFINKESITSEDDANESADNEFEKSLDEKDARNVLKDKIVDDPIQNEKMLTVENETRVDTPEKGSKLNDKKAAVEAISVKDKATAISEKDKSVKKDKVANDPLIRKDVSEGIAKDVVTGVAKTQKGKGEVDLKIDAETNKKVDKVDPSIQKDNSEINKTKAGIAATENKKDNPVDKTETEENKRSIFDAIEEDKNEAEVKVAERDIKSWEVTPNFGPVYYNTLGGGSAIDPTFADNSQSGDVNFSYGVQVSYAINERLSLRSGVSNVDLGYRTGDVELATGPVAAALGTIDYGGKSTVLSAFDRGTLSNLPPPGQGNPFSGLVPKSTSGNVELIQNLSYYEVPLELKYALINNRFGINMIGGFSTLFLGANEVSVKAGEFRDVLGEANNLNSVSFSTNVGLGFDYKISKRLKFNVEPMFKYQLNPYTDSSVGFKPYYLGIYSGLSFKF